MTSAMDSYSVFHFWGNQVTSMRLWFSPYPHSKSKASWASGQILKVTRNRAPGSPEGLDHALGHTAGGPHAVLAGDDVFSMPWLRLL